MITNAARLGLLALASLAVACSPDGRPVGPKAVSSLAADAVAEDQVTYGPWGVPVNLGPVVNSPYNDNHPAISKDGLSLYITSDRPGGLGGSDIWVSHRATVDDPWDTPLNLGPNINSAGNEAAPTFTPDGHHMYFHSTGRGGCGLADIFDARRRDKDDDFGWEPAENLDFPSCVVNTGLFENGPTFFEDEATGVQSLYFTSLNRPGGLGDFDVWLSQRGGDDEPWGPAVDVPELSSPGRDTRTAIRHDGLEMFISSGRPGGVGSEDLWVSTRGSTRDSWGTPINLGPVVNSTAFDGAPTLSFDGTTLYFFSERAGGFGKRDLYVTTRTRLSGPD